MALLILGVLIKFAIMKKKLFLLPALLFSAAACFAQTNIETVTDFPTGYLKATNPYYFGSKDGVLYLFLGRDPFILVRYPAADPRESFTIPGGVSRIAHGAFKGCTNLKELIIPSSVYYIAEDAFDDTDISSFVVSGNDVSAGAPGVEVTQETATYDLAGNPLDSPRQGVNIMVNKGEVKKVLVK